MMLFAFPTSCCSCIQLLLRMSSRTDVLSSSTTSGVSGFACDAALHSVALLPVYFLSKMSCCLSCFDSSGLNVMQNAVLS